jgi:hypothetical protein
LPPSPIPAPDTGAYSRGSPAASCDQTIEEENRKLKQLVGELTLDNAALKDVVAKKW